MMAGFLMLNKNIILSLSASLTLSAVVAEVFAKQESYLNSTFTLIAGYCVYYTVFSTLYYIDNRKVYRTDSGRTDNAKLRRDLKKIIFTIGVGEVSFLAAKWIAQYHLLTQNYEPYVAAILAHLVASALLLGTMNLAAKKTKLYK